MKYKIPIALIIALIIGIMLQEDEKEYLIYEDYESEGGFNYLEDVIELDSINIKHRK
jgi:hypothetical protein